MGKRAYGPQDEPEAYLDGIKYAESRGSRDPSKAVGDQGQSRGAYQMKKILYADLQRTNKRWNKTTYEQMLSNPELQRSAAHDGLKMLKYHKGYQFTGAKLKSAYNTGPTAANKGVLNKKYVDTVNTGIKKAPYKGGLEQFRAP